MTTRRCSSRCAPEAEALAMPQRSQAPGRRASRSMASRSPSRTISTSPGLPTTAACPAFAYTPRTIGLRRRAARARRRDRHRQDQSRPVRDRPRRRALALRRSAQRAARRSHSRRLELRLGDRGRRRARAVLARHRHGGLGPRAGGAQRHRRPEAVARRAFRRPASFPPAGRSTRSRSSRSTSPTPSRSFRSPCAYRRERRLFAAPFRAACAVGAAERPAARRSPRRQRQFFGDAEAEAAFARDVDRRRSRSAPGSSSSTSSRSPRSRALLYEGPWVAERYAATKPLIESRPEALHPVTRAIIEGARKFDAVAAFEAFYQLAGAEARDEAARGCGVRRDARSDHAAPLHDRRGRGRSGRASIRGSGPTPISSTCSISAPSPFPRACAATGCRRA